MNSFSAWFLQGDSLEYLQMMKSVNKNNLAFLLMLVFICPICSFHLASCTG